MMGRIRVEVEQDNGWTRWIRPVRKGYRIACCDCGLCHSIEFRIKSGRVQFRARRNNISTGLLRRKPHGATIKEPA